MAGRIGIIIASALIAHTPWHWMMDRAAMLRQYDWTLSGPAALASLLRVAMVVVAIVGAVWLWRIRRQSRPRP